MKRGALLGTIALLVVACSPPKEPKQASAPDPVDDSLTSTAGGANEGSSSASPSNDGHAPPAAKGAPAKGDKNDASQVSTLAIYQEGLKWGMSHADVTKAYTQTNGVIWKDYDDKLAKARVGPEMTALEAEREQTKAAFGRSFIEFKDTPTGYDATGIKNEYTYKNKEALMWIQRPGKKRYFFFINDRLWKVYDEVRLGDGTELGKTYVDAVNLTNSKLGVQGRILQPDAAKGVSILTVDWKDGTSHLRMVDRSANEGIVGVIIEDQNTLSNLASLRANKAEDPTALDPSITAVTKGGLSDPNAPTTASSATPSATKAGSKPPAKKK